MLLTPHTVAGAAIGAAVADPVLAIPAALLSHFALDLVPHWDEIEPRRWAERYRSLSPRSFRIILLDALLGLAFTLLFVYWALPDYGVGVRILASVTAANLPDLFYIPLAFFGKRWGWAMWVVELQGKIQAKSRAPILFGLSTQLFVVVVGSLIARQEILVQLPRAWRIL